MWWKSSRRRLVADDVINEQISLNLELRLNHPVHIYAISHSATHMAIAHITAYLVFESLYFSQIPARSKSDTVK